MKILVVIGHQSPGSYCHAIAQTAIEELEARGHEIVFHDLYQEHFAPVLPAEEVPKDRTPAPEVARHCAELLAADGLVIVHPNWWGQPPAMLKGWIDRVLRQGVAYEFGEGGAVVGHLAGKTAVVLTTSNTPRDAELELFGDPLQNLWERCILGFCGVTDFERRNFESIILSTFEQRTAWLQEVRGIIRRRF